MSKTQKTIFILVFLVGLSSALYFLLKGNLLLARLIPLGVLIVWGLLIATKNVADRKKIFIRILALIVVGAVSVYIYYLGHPGIFSKPLASTTMPPTQPCPAESPITWKQYTNSVLGMNFSYPSGNTVSVGPVNGDLSGLVVGHKSRPCEDNYYASGQEIDILVSLYNESWEAIQARYAYPFYTKSDLVLSGEQAVQYVSPERNSMNQDAHQAQIYLQHNGKTYQIVLEDSDAVMSKTFLQTFKFTK